MFTTPSKGYLFGLGTLNYLQRDHLVMAGLIVAIASTNLVSRRIEVITPLKSAIPVLSPAAEVPSASEDADAVAGVSLTAPMRVALEHVARRYRLSVKALAPIFEAAQAAGRERNIEPLLLIAVISVESRFNPYSQSIVGAQGLMQIIPRYYLDKIPDGSGDMPFLNPVINVRIGAQILQENILQHGSLIAGLQKYGGAVADEGHSYANRVLAEKKRLDQISHRGVSTGA
jgi:soluble lytic murein transglycosylase-like protein